MPETYGRDEAGVSHISTGHASPTTAIAAPPAASERTAAARPRGAIHSHAATIPGTTSSAAAIFVSKPRPTSAPDTISHFVEPSRRSPRSIAQSAAVMQSTSSASGLLWREIATVIGVSASVSPATVPAARPNRDRARS